MPDQPQNVVISGWSFVELVNPSTGLTRYHLPQAIADGKLRCEGRIVSHYKPTREVGSLYYTSGLDVLASSGRDMVTDTEPTTFVQLQGPPDPAYVAACLEQGWTLDPDNPLVGPADFGADDGSVTLDATTQVGVVAQSTPPAAAEG